MRGRKKNAAPMQDASQAPITRVLVLSDSFLPHAGGSREYYNNIYRGLAGASDSPVVILTKKVPGWREFDEKVCSDWFRIYRRFKPLASWKYLELPKGIFPLLQAAWHTILDWPSIIHAGDLYPPGLIAMIFKRVLGLPYAVYCHGEEITQTDRFRFQPLVRDQIYKNADAVIANSEFARQNLLRIGVASEKIHKITPGVDAVRFRPQAPSAEMVKRYGLEGKIVVLTVARLVARKGHQATLRAFASICHDIPDAQYLIVGTGPEEPRIRQLAQELNITERVTFAGYVPEDHLPGIYNLGDIMVMPNRQEEDGDVEGFGIVFLEANAAAKPVIGGRSGGAVEAIEHGVTGFLVNPEDVTELANVMRRLLLERKLREEIGAAGMNRVRTEFNWDSRVRALRDVNNGILETLRRSSKGQSEPAKGHI